MWLQDARFSLNSDDRIPIFARIHGCNRPHTGLARKLGFVSAMVILLYEREGSRLYKPYATLLSIVADN